MQSEITGFAEPSTTGSTTANAKDGSDHAMTGRINTTLNWIPILPRLQAIRRKCKMHPMEWMEFVIIIGNLLHNAMLCCAMLIRGRPLNVWEGPGISCTLILRAKKFLQGNTRGENFFLYWQKNYLSWLIILETPQKSNVRRRSRARLLLVESAQQQWTMIYWNLRAKPTKSNVTLFVIL